MSAVSASREVIEHAGKLHAQRCPSIGVIETDCPCGACRALCCGTCREPVFWLLLNRRECLHSLELADTSHPDWWGARS